MITQKRRKMSTLVSSLPTVNIHQPLDEGQTVDGACKEQFASTLTDQPEALHTVDVISQEYIR